MLTVYRASAGSGKTYQLTGEYLKLLFNGSNSFRRILAVTFTNKATEEMKSRIIQELDLLARKGDSGYLFLLMSEFSLTSEQVFLKAHRILLEILHDYSSFNISTIDRFFQQTMRAFAREIGLQGGYNVELDTKRVLSEAVDKMLFTLDEPANRDVLNWLLKFSENKIENGKSWNFKKEVVDLGEELFKEKYKRLSSDIHQKLANKEVLKEYQQKLNRVVVDFESKLSSIGKEGVSFIQKCGFAEEDFAGGTNSPLKHFAIWAKNEVKIPTNTFRKLEDDIEQWKAAAKSKQFDFAIKTAYSSGLNDFVKRALVLFDEYPIYNSAIIIRKNIYALGILSDIDMKIKELVAENNLMLLSDTTHLLNKLIDGSDTPFIYEKIGVRIEHYMIDEFQDTSVMQWQNFSPLIHESLSQKVPELNKLSNLIVGDVKQSIYRWRSSDWKLLEDQLGREFLSQMKDEVLSENWRSGSAIIGFNNAFFTSASEVLRMKFIDSIPLALKDNPILSSYSEKIKSAYRDVYQTQPEKKKGITGHVKIKWVETDATKQWMEDVLDFIPKEIEQWLSRGYSLRDMAVLVRTKDEGSRVADCLLDHKFAVISDEALMLKNASAIKLIVALLKHIRRPDDLNLRRLALIEYAVLNRPTEDAVSLFFQHSNDVLAQFPKNKLKELEVISRLPLYEMCERIIAQFIEYPTVTDNLYLQSFQDVVLEFSTRKSPDLIAFLDWWEEVGASKRVSMPDSQDAIRIMTIHKSKGLGFKAVLVPFCDWGMDQKSGNMLWVTPEIEPFNDLPLLPVPYGKDLTESIFVFDYLEEKLHAYVDNLNLAYVTFTRAKEELVIFAPKTKNDSTERLGGLLYECVNHSDLKDEEGKSYLNLNADFSLESKTYEAGCDWVPPITFEKKPKEEQSVNIRSINPDGRLQLKLRGSDYFTDTNEQIYGKIMHEILSRIQSISDIDNSVAEVVNLGEISSKIGTEIIVKLRKWIDQPNVDKWFMPDTKVLNEAEILLPEGVHYRPDRVVFFESEVHVIDFKFGQNKLQKYHRQVSTYMSLISRMGHTVVKGFLWYVELNEVEEVLN
ncbi:MAG: UvrD-helicase domain-containing protein [Bacteroidales bacterium]|nr:UvrD-helicase domain-containing protein [Bacteroidales bacterium]